MPLVAFGIRISYSGWVWFLKIPQLFPHLPFFRCLAAVAIGG